MHRIIILGVAIAALLAATAIAAAQETPEPAATQSAATPTVIPTRTPYPTVPPGEVDICANPLPERIVKLALEDDERILAIVTPLEDYDRVRGIRIRIDSVIEGSVQPGEVVADANTGACRAERVWSSGQALFASLRVFPGGVDSRAGWPVLAADGGPFDAAELAAGGSADQLIVVLDDGERVTVAELMQRGRDFVEPGPTPGSRTPSTLTEADAGGVTAPDTGTGASRGSGGAPWAAIGVGALLVAMVAAGLYGLRRGRRV